MLEKIEDSSNTYCWVISKPGGRLTCMASVQHPCFCWWKSLNHKSYKPVYTTCRTSLQPGWLLLGHHYKTWLNTSCSWILNGFLFTKFLQFRKWLESSILNPFLLPKRINKNANNRKKTPNNSIKTISSICVGFFLPSLNLEKSHSLLDILEVFCGYHSADKYNSDSNIMWNYSRNLPFSSRSW